MAGSTLAFTRDQLAVLRTDAEARFAAELRANVAAFAPARAEAAAADGVAALVDRGLARTAALGLTQRGPRRFWIETMIVLGADFDRDPQYAALMPEIDPETFPMPYAEALHRAVAAFLGAVFGPERTHLLAAVEALRAFGPPEPSPDSAAWLRGLIASVWPEKRARLGDAALTALAGETDAAAARLGFETDAGRCLCALLGVCFGAGVFDDPTYPWLARRLGADRPEAELVPDIEAALGVYADKALTARMRG